MVYILFRNEAEPMMIRPAAFVFATPSGLAWVEPSYADPYGASSPAFHQRAGTLERNKDGFILKMAGDDEIEIGVYPFNDEDPAMGDDLGPLRWFAEHLKENHLQWQAERELVRSMLALSD